jgi:microcystin-dependent protein
MATKTFIRTASQTSSVIPGAIMQYAGITAPSGYLLCNGSQVLRSAYSTLFNILNPNIGTASISIEDPALVTIGNHGMKEGDKFYFTTTGSLPTGLSANTLYFVNYISSSSFHVSTSRVNAFNGINLVTSGTQSGVHSIVRSPYGNGDGSITFHLPDFRGRVATGTHSNSVSDYFKTHGETGGAVDHTHSFSDTSNATNSNTTNLVAAGNTASISRPTTSHTHNISGTTGTGEIAPYITVNYIIKT